MGHEWRLDPEIKREAWVYSYTGGIADDPFWHGLELRREINPERFDANHPNEAGFFVPPAVLGQLPHGPELDYMRNLFHINPHRFSINHHFWGPLYERESHLSGEPVPVLPPSPPPAVTPGVPVPLPPPAVGGAAVPEPSSIVPGITGLALVLVFLWRRSR